MAGNRINTYVGRLNALKKTTTILLALLCVCLLTGLTTYSRATVSNRVKLKIVQPKKAQVAVWVEKTLPVPQEPAAMEAAQKDKEPCNLWVQNNSTYPVTIEYIRCVETECADAVKTDLPGGASARTLQPNQKLKVALTAELAIIGRAEPLKFECKTTWEDGEATIQFDVPVKQVKAPVIAVVETAPVTRATEETDAA